MLQQSMFAHEVHSITETNSGGNTKDPFADDAPDDFDTPLKP